MHAVLGATNALNEPLVGLVGGPRYYARFGFRLGEEYDTAFTSSLRGRFAYAQPFNRI